MIFPISADEGCVKPLAKSAVWSREGQCAARSGAPDERLACSGLAGPELRRCQSSFGLSCCRCSPSSDRSSVHFTRNMERRFANTASIFGARNIPDAWVERYHQDQPSLQKCPVSALEIDRYNARGAERVICEMSWAGIDNKRPVAHQCRAALIVAGCNDASAGRTRPPECPLRLGGGENADPSTMPRNSRARSAAGPGQSCRFAGWQPRIVEKNASISAKALATARRIRDRAAPVQTRN